VKWFEVVNLRILVVRPLVGGARSLSLVDAIEAQGQLAACIEELAAKLDVRQPPSRSGSDD
jgi:hypothetical protein